MFRTLIDGATLSGRLADPDWLVVDVRHQLADPAAGERAYAAGHLPGAVFLHLDRDLSGPLTGRNGRHPLPDPQDLAACFSEIGIGEKTQVVVYDAAGGMIASRLWWLLRWLGHDAVALLDGGWSTWLAAGGATTRDLPRRPAARFESRLRPQMLVELDEVQNNLLRQDFLLLDARSPDRFRGENETLDPVGGHIPGARNRFLKDNLAADGLLKPVAQLRAEYAEVLGGFPPERVVHQCGSGVSACLSLIAMEHAGLSGSRLYAGSWSEWCADPARPMVLRTA
jgi:thiosulfate/3-mercaptopyruvate sulfurtransferase